MSNYLPRFASFYHSNHLFFYLFRFVSGYRLYRFDSGTNLITKTTRPPSLLHRVFKRKVTHAYNSRVGIRSMACSVYYEYRFCKDCAKSNQADFPAKIRAKIAKLWSSKSKERIKVFSKCFPSQLLASLSHKLVSILF